VNEEIRTLKLPIPKTRHYFAYGNGDWTYRTLLALSQIKPEIEAAVIRCSDDGAKRSVKRIHSLAVRYGFRVTCRTMRDATVLVWVKKPGVDKNVTKLWRL
jgi:hypothetical protein